MAFFKSSQTARLQAIFICESAGQPMIAVDSIVAIKDEGLKGDRYQTKKVTGILWRVVR